MRIGKAIVQTMPIPRAMKASGSSHCLSWPRIAPKARPPTARAMTTAPSQSNFPVAFSSRDSAMWTRVA